MNHVNLIEQAIVCLNNDRSPAFLPCYEIVRKAGTDIEAIESKFRDSETVFPFTSKRKRSSRIIENAIGNGGYDKRLLVKGATELVIESCSHYINEEGARVEIAGAASEMLRKVVTHYAMQAYRTLGYAYKDLEEGEGGDNHCDPIEEPIKDVEKGGLTLICVIAM